MLTHASTVIFFFIYLINSPQGFSRTCQCCRDLSPFPSLCTSNLNSSSCALNYKTNGSFLPDNATKGVVPASVFTNAGRGCCYLQPIFSQRDQSFPPDSRFGTLTPKEVCTEERNPWTLWKSIICPRHNIRWVKKKKSVVNDKHTCQK